MVYDHQNHVGNAGDLWKHLVLTETADWTFRKSDVKLYVESHAGWPQYVLSPKGEWEDGINRCWHSLDGLRDFTYFRILETLNPHGLETYPGSASLVMMVARSIKCPLKAELWDMNPQVQRAWSQVKASDVHFRLGDGFLGSSALSSRYCPAFLLVDPPYITEEEVKKAEDLIYKAVGAGWIVLCWYMNDMKRVPHPSCNYKTFTLDFRRSGLECGPWTGATMILAGGDDDLNIWLNLRTEKFLKAISVGTSESF